MTGGPTLRQAGIVARGELLARRRSRATAVGTTAFAIFVAVVAWTATLPRGGRRSSYLVAFSGADAAAPTAVVVFGLGALLTYLIPVVAVAVAAGTVAGGVESGTVRTLQSLPVSRPAVVVGKLAAGLVTAAAVVLAGLAAGGAVAAIRFGGLDVAAYGGFALASMAYALALTATAVGISGLVVTRLRAVGASLGSFFVLAVLGVDPGLVPRLRTWLLVQPYHVLVAAAHDRLVAVPMLQYAAVTPGVDPAEALAAPPFLLTEGAAVLGLLAWPAVALPLALVRYRGRDLLPRGR